MKIHGTAPEANEAAELEPARYFNLAIEQIREITGWMKTTDQAAQPLLVHVDIFVHLARKYPDMARRRIRNLDIPDIRQAFDDWYERCKRRIPAKYREGIRESADGLFRSLEEIAG